MKITLPLVWLVFVFCAPAMAEGSPLYEKKQQWCYECSLACLGSVASLRLTIDPLSQPQTYRLILQGEGRGLLGWLNGDRQQYYESVVRLNSNDTIVPLLHFHQTEITQNFRRIQYGWRFTHSEESATVKGERLWGGKVVETVNYDSDYNEHEPRQVVGDFLSALFSFMVHGSQPLEIGQQYTYDVFWGDKYVALNINVIEYHDQKRWECRVVAEEPCLPGGGNEMYFYCDDNRVPLSAVSHAVFGRVRVSRARCLEE